MLRQPNWTRMLPSGFVVNFATLGPIGYWPAPGTWGSFAGLMWYTVASAPAGWLGSLLFTAAGIYLAFAFCGEAEARLSKVDPPEIVLDEFACMPLALLGLQDVLATRQAWVAYVLAFVLFRLFDIVKPFGIGALQRFRGGAGVVLDDVAAGLAACGVLQVILRFSPLLDWLGRARAPGLEAG